MMQWRDSSKGMTDFDLNWFRRLDPYVLWAVASGWRYQRQVHTPEDRGRVGQGPPSVRLLARFDSNLPQGSTGGTRFEQLRAEGWKIPAVYDDPLAVKAAPVWFTATVPATRVEDLLRGKCKPAKGVVWELAVPMREAETSAQANPLGLFGERDPAAYRSESRPFDSAVTEAANRKPARTLNAVLAAVDFGGAFLHTEFRDGAATKTRVHALWDQGAEAGDWRSWTKPACMDYGCEITSSTIDELLDKLCESAADETDVYRELDHLIDYDDARRRIWAATHGTHVLHVAGGRHDPLLAAGANPQDAASKASLIFVQVPSLSAADCSGASMGAHLLDAVHYILSECKPGAKVVVNISHGTYAGPHDGSSMIEQALADLVDARPHSLALVLAAGNARKRQGHTRRLVRRNFSARLRLELGAGDSTPTFVEIWCKKASDKSTLSRVRLRVRSSTGDWSDWVKPNGVQFLGDASTGWPAAMVRHQHKVPGSKMAMMLVAIAPTMQPADDDGPLAPPGIWEIEVGLEPLDDKTKKDPATLLIDAYVERDDPGDFSAGEQPHFLGVDADDGDECLSSLCSGRNVIVAGGFRRGDGVQATYSSVGTTHRKSWKVMGACEESDVRPGICAAAVRSGETFVMNGTSVAAPVVARRLYNWMVDPANAKTLRNTGWQQMALDAIVAAEHEKGGSRAVKNWPD